MPSKADWLLVRATAFESDQVGAPLPEDVVLDPEARVFQQSAQKARARLLAAGRVDRVHAHQLAGQLHHIACCLHTKFLRPRSSIPSLLRRSAFSRQGGAVRTRLWAGAALVNATETRLARRVAVKLAWNGPVRGRARVIGSLLFAQPPDSGELSGQRSDLSFDRGDFLLARGVAARLLRPLQRL